MAALYNDPIFNNDHDLDHSMELMRHSLYMFRIRLSALKVYDLSNNDDFMQRG